MAKLPRTRPKRSSPCWSTARPSCLLQRPRHTQGTRSSCFLSYSLRFALLSALLRSALPPTAAGCLVCLPRKPKCGAPPHARHEQPNAPRTRQLQKMSCRHTHRIKAYETIPIIKPAPFRSRATPILATSATRLSPNAENHASVLL